MEHWKHALIVAAAPCTELDCVRSFLERTPDVYIICADGGRCHLEKLGVIPDLMIADFDSADGECSCGELIRLIPEKDDTDTMACVREALARGFSEITLVCATGGRLDHELANLGLCEWAANRGARLQVLDSQNLIFLHPGGELLLERDAAYPFISLIPLDATLTGVCMSGLKYPLEEATVTREAMLTVSNEPTADQFIITVGAGRALVIFAKD